MKTYILNVINGEESFRTTIDANRYYIAYHIMSAGCRALLPGFGDAKASKLYDLTESGGTFVYKYQGNTIKLVIEVIG